MLVTKWEAEAGRRRLLKSSRLRNRPGEEDAWHKAESVYGDNFPLAVFLFLAPLRAQDMVVGQERS